MQSAVFYRDLFGLVGDRSQRPQSDVPLLVYENADDAHVNGVAWTLRWFVPRVLRNVTRGLDVRNVFDSRYDVAATVDGYPNLEINTLYDDYGASRAETGRPGGAYWNDRNGDGVPGWVPVHDPRLIG